LFEKGNTTMRKQATVTLSDEQAKIVIDFLRTTPIKGNLETLPSVLSQMLEIIKKLDDAFDDRPKEG
jgi:hypothetical protein